MKKIALALILVMPLTAKADESPFFDGPPEYTKDQALVEGLLAEGSKDRAVGNAIDFRSFTEKQNYIETGNIYGDKSDAPVKFNFGGTTITGDPLGGAQRKYQVEKFESQQRAKSPWIR